MSYQRRNKNTEKRKPINYGKFTCAKCGKPITEIIQALNEPETGLPVHFDCARESILENEVLEKNAELIYLGKGSFGIVEFENPHNRKKFKIIKTITFETPDTEVAWRSEVKDTFDQTLNKS